MAASLTITLDLTPPSVALGPASRLPSHLIAVPYVIDEPAISSAQINGVPATVGPAQIVSAQTMDAGGNVAVTGVAVDDVGNAQPFSGTSFIGPYEELQVIDGDPPRLGGYGLRVA